MDLHVLFERLPSRLNYIFKRRKIHRLNYTFKKIQFSLAALLEFVDRTRAKKTLEKYDIPAAWIEKWYQSLTGMKRFWHIGEVVSDLKVTQVSQKEIHGVLSL